MGIFTNKDYNEFIANLSSVTENGVNQFLPIEKGELEKKLVKLVRINVKKIKKDGVLYLATKKTKATPTAYPFFVNEYALPFEDLKPPNAKNITKGRCNLEKELFWYLADSPKTATLEARIPVGSSFTIFKFKTDKLPKIIDLTEWKDIVHSKNIDERILSLICSYFQTPFYFNKSVYDVCVYFINIFKSFGFKGVAWRSSWQKGNCIVLFEGSPGPFIESNRYILNSFNPETAPPMDF